jgi:hypothetical protein
MLKNTRIGDLINTLSGVNESLLWQNAGNDWEVKQSIADIQREQLRAGERPDGTNFDPYSDASVNFYGKPAGPIQWYDDGEFYDSIEPVFTEETIELGQAITTGDNGETINLETDYNEQILGIQENNLQPIQEQIKQNYIEQLRWFLDDY